MQGARTRDFKRARTSRLGVSISKAQYILLSSIITDTLKAAGLGGEPYTFQLLDTRISPRRDLGVFR
jgi:hypothetical protein